AQRIAKLDAWRITLTPAALNAAERVVFMVSGSDKADVVRDVLRGPFQPDKLPAQVIHPDSGQLIWLLDRAAAAML
ncbi:MAG: 6-phosphogluconolactonase, partial [Anaerolineae bacterium]|nr:6-phosphogluconolactonase [Anaerolineae bacterium]